MLLEDFATSPEVLVMFVQRWARFMWRASATSAWPPLRQARSELTRCCASCTSASRASVTSVCTRLPRKAASCWPSSFLASSKRPASPCAMARSSASVTSTRCRWATTSTSGSPSGSAERATSRQTTGVCAGARSRTARYRAEARKMGSWPSAAPAAAGTRSSTTKSRRSPSKASGTETTAAPAAPASRRCGKCVCTAASAQLPCGSMRSSMACAETLMRPATAPAKASLMECGCSTKVKGVCAVSEMADSTAVSWSAPKPKG
mmetsp:Transcript_116845/g.363108  ORF Transcript_116845/g.363108 Transcript_116845/m.363108 type:complete len:263 (-) Transcript_116845:876-1664(-)